MSDIAAADNGKSPPRRRGWARRLRRAAVLYVAIPYLSVLAMLGLAQRFLIYHPTRASSIRPEEADLPAGQVHTIVATADDGLELRGWHVLADGRTAGSREDCDRELAAGRWLVLYFPGNAGNRSHRASNCQDFTCLKADVFLFDYRGYGDNRGSPSESALAADARTVWKYATEQRGVAPERILLFGESLGGAVATRLAAEMCEAGTPPGGLILRATFSSLTDEAAWHYPFFPVRMLLLDRYPAAERMGSVSCPVIQIHGALDDIVPIELGRKLFASVPDCSVTGIGKQFVELPRTGHNDISHTEISNAVAGFLNAIDAQEKRR